MTDEVVSCYLCGQPLLQICVGVTFLTNQALAGFVGFLISLISI